LESTIKIDSVVDPELLAGSGSGKDHSGSDSSGSQINLEYNSPEELLNLTISQQKCSIKNINSFFPKNFAKKFISRHNSNLKVKKFIRREYKGKISIKNMRKFM
jgi:hypothetical protein